ncbi:MAG: acriflavin resistance protein [Elusimicrobia bacterium RIFOXYA2_FULL_58_8]|nr:MAG: acriflavin resistance protein [Elusimicrobia bacterium RIFOXYA12_FULL_57_11]OGS15528.1 MAG: acriflavin resistance protein [Elusimicrobia bacterium RIFOXYA2_FULL_58_8]
MTLSDLSIKNPVFAWMLMIGLIAFGWMGFSQMGISQMPDVDYPVVNVRVNLPGAAPEIMETQVTDVLEGAVMGIQGIKELSSSSKRGSSNVTIEFELNRDIDVAMQEVQSKISQAQHDLPRDIDPPSISKTNPEDQPIIRIALSGDRPRKDLMLFTNDYLKDKFTTIAGVGDVDMGGYIDPNLRIWLNVDELNAKQLTVTDVINTVQSQHDETPAGYIDTGKKEFNVRVLGEAATPEEFSKLIITGRGGAAIWKNYRIKDVANVEDGLADIRRVSHVNGVTSVGLGIVKQRGSNAVALARAVHAKVDQLQKTLPQGMKLTVVNDTTRFIEESTRELNFTLILSAILTGLVCWAFLGSWSSTINVLLAIPTSIIGAFIILYFMGFTLNTFTLLGLSLAIGIVVDDAIMVLENIVRYNEMGYSRVKAAIVGAREITFPAMAASVAILAIFVPVIFMKGIIGKFFFQFGVTMTAAVMLSLLEALTLSPMRCSQFLSVERTTAFGRWMDGLLRRTAALYRRILERLLDHRWKTLGIAGLVFVVSLAVGRKLPQEFTPSQDQSMFLMRLQTPIGSSFEHTSSVFAQAEKWASQQPNIITYFGMVGMGDVNSASLFVNLKPPAQRVPLTPGGRKPNQQILMQHARKALKEIKGFEKVSIQDLSQAGFSGRRGGFPVELSLRGPDWDKLGELSQEIKKLLTDSGKVVDADTDYLTGMPELLVVPDREKAAARGVNMAAIGDSINAMIGGLRIGKFTKDGKRYDINVRLVNKDRRASSDIGKIWVRNNRGELIKLSEIVAIKEKNTLMSISRRNRERAISIFANPAPGFSQKEALDEAQRIGSELLPEGYRLLLSGSSQTFKESFGSLLTALVLGIFVAYMVLGAQFNSFLHPVTVLLALPFSVTGAFLALKLGGQTLNIYSMIGMILLMGIVKKNSILLVDFTNHRRREGGMGVKEALLEACPIRLRPILMTSFATIAAAIPPALGIGPGAETRIPMALVVIGGVLLSTFLTLLVVPCAYSLLSPFESRRHATALKQAMKELGEMPEGN